MMLHKVWQDNTDVSGGDVLDRSPLSSFHRDIGIAINFQEESGLGPFGNSELCGPLEVSSDVSPPVQMRWDIGFSLGTAQNIQTSLFIVRRKTNLHSSPCKEIQLSFDSGNLGIHGTWRSKFRVPLTYRLLREGSS